MSRLLEKFPRAAQSFIRDAVEGRLGLPLPEENEYRPSKDEMERSAVALLTPVACALRIAWMEEVPVVQGGIDKNDRILQPLGRLTGENVFIDVNPGIFVPALRAPYFQGVEWLRLAHLGNVRVKRPLEKQGYDFRDFRIHNIGFLSQTETEDEPEGFAVNLDPGALRLPAYRWEGVPEPVSQPTPVQDAHYGDLCAAFSAAAAGLIRAGDFWRICAGAAKTGRLVADWQAVDFRDNPIFAEPRDLAMPEIAAAYEKRLRQRALFAAL